LRTEPTVPSRFRSKPSLWKFYGRHHDLVDNHVLSYIPSLTTYHLYRVTRRLPLVARTAFPSGAPGFISVFRGVRVAQSLVFNIVFFKVINCLSFCPCSYDHCIFCSSIYGLWLPLWHLQTFLISECPFFIIDFLYVISDFLFLTVGQSWNCKD
jgi:hypothetical protein